MFKGNETFLPLCVPIELCTLSPIYAVLTVSVLMYYNYLFIYQSPLSDYEILEKKGQRPGSEIGL